MVNSINFLGFNDSNLAYILKERYSRAGSNPIDITDPNWQVYLLVQKAAIEQEDSILSLLGFAAIYQFYKYPDSMRLRLGQVCFLLMYMDLNWEVS